MRYLFYFYLFVLAVLHIYNIHLSAILAAQSYEVVRIEQEIEHNKKRDADLEVILANAQSIRALDAWAKDNGFTQEAVPVEVIYLKSDTLEVPEMAIEPEGTSMEFYQIALLTLAFVASQLPLNQRSRYAVMAIIGVITLLLIAFNLPVSA